MIKLRKLICRLIGHEYNLIGLHSDNFKFKCLKCGYEKEKGFPQHHDEGISQHWAGTKIKSCYCPPLEELIEACGNEYRARNQNTKEKKPCDHLFRLGWTGDGWYSDYEFYKSSPEINGIPIMGEGDTPSEAVANLWLKLNEKPTP